MYLKNVLTSYEELIENPDATQFKAQSTFAFALALDELLKVKKVCFLDAGIQSVGGGWLDLFQFHQFYYLQCFSSRFYF